MTSFVKGYNTLSYQGVNAGSPPNLRVINRDPTPNDTVEFVLGDLWINKTTQNVFQLTSLGTQASPNTANWSQIGFYTGNFTLRSGNIILSTAGSYVQVGGGARILSGAGDPNNNIIAPIGSIYLRTDNGVSMNNRAYINTDGVDDWASITTGT